VTIADRFPFVQLELAGTVGLESGRYLAHEPERVLVVAVAGAPPPARRRLRRAKPRDSDPDPSPPTVPLTTLTVVRPEPLGNADAAREWLQDLRAEPEAVEAEVSAALAVVNRAVHAHRSAAMDPAIPDVSPEAALALRIGFGVGDEMADGRFESAVEIPRSERRQRRAEALRPQERVAAVLGGRETVPSCEPLLLRARGDLDSGRVREAALQLRVGLEALLAERDAFSAAGQSEDLGALDDRRRITGEAANEALRGELDDERTAEMIETLRLCERVVRRQRALG
jgi:hypothetical protein